MPHTPLEFRNVLERHVDWRCRLTTSFISMTDNPHAVDWQVAIRERVRRRNIMIAIIDTAALLCHCRASIWEMQSAMKHYGVSPPGKLTLGSFDNEYICALRVPSVAIVRLCTPLDFRARALEYIWAKSMGSDSPLLKNRSSQGEFGNVLLQALRERPSWPAQNQSHFI